MLARRKLWQPRPAGITSLSFLNIFKCFSWIPCSSCSLELYDTESLCVDVFIQPGLHFHIETWLNKLITVKLYDVRKRLRCEEDFKMLSQGSFTGYLCLWYSLGINWWKNSACNKRGANNISARKVYLWRQINLCMGNPAFTLFWGPTNAPQTCLVDVEKLHIFKKNTSILTCAHLSILFPPQ